MARKPVVHKNDAHFGGNWRYSRCGSLATAFGKERFTDRWNAVTCKSCLRFAPKAVKVRLGIA